MIQGKLKTLMTKTKSKLISHLLLFKFQIYELYLYDLQKME